MRRVPLLSMLVAVASTSLAAPAPTTTWADWVGEWTGKLTWTSCTADGFATAALPLEATDGAVAIDLTPAGGALGMMTLVDESGSWLGHQADVTVHVTRPKADVLEVAVDLDSGCQMRARMQRASTGIAACDRLVAWSRIESRCAKLDKPPLEPAARLARQRDTWAKARTADRKSAGSALKEIAAQCEARSTKVEAELIDVGCAPNADPEIGTRGPQCQAVRQIAARFARCTSSPPDLRSRFEQDAAQLAAAAQTADSSGLPIIDAECRTLRARIASAAQHYVCAP
jgi:hypothetical protein